MTEVAVVTGANSGIGRATAVHLASAGYRVFGTVRRLESAAKLSAMAADAGTAVELLQMDVSDDESVRSAFARVGDVHVLVNNAGVGANAVVEETTPALLADVMNVNLYGALRCMRAVLPGMRERGSGAIVNVTSVTGRIALPGQAPYTASKWALEALSEELAMEVAAHGIRIAVVEPGVTHSAIFAKNADVPTGSGAYETQYQRMFNFYAACIPHATDPFVVAALIHEAATTPEPRLRYPCSYGGPEVIAGRAGISDEEWVGLGRVDDDAYYGALEQLTGLPMRP